MFAAGGLVVNVPSRGSCFGSLEWCSGIFVFTKLHPTRHDPSTQQLESVSQPMIRALDGRVLSCPVPSLCDDLRSPVAGLPCFLPSRALVHI